MDNFENLILIIDEIVDEGLDILNWSSHSRIIITLEYVTVIARATMKDTETVKLPSHEGGFSSVKFISIRVIDYRSLRMLKRKLWLNLMV